MGQVISAVLAENEREHEEDTVEQLQILQKLAAAKLEAKAIKLATDAFEDKCLPIVAVVDKVERYAVKVESAPAPKVQQCIDDIFEGHFLEGLEHAVCTAMDELLGNTSAGEQERSETHVVFANNTLLRVDYYCYKYEFGSHGLRDKFRNAFSYVVQVGVLDNIRVDPQVALYELGKSIGRDQISEATENLEEDANLLEKLYHVIHRLRQAAAGEKKETTMAKENSSFRQKSSEVRSQYLITAERSASGASISNMKYIRSNMAFKESKGEEYSSFGVQMNSAGVPAKKGKTGLYYCGRPILNCSCCDGHCGPDNGCNCSSCQKLDREEQE